MSGLRVDDIPMVCISLDRRPDRWTAFQRYANAAGIKVDRLSAVDAKQFEAWSHPAVSLGTAHNLKYKTRRAYYEIDAPGAVGASLSHFKAWTMARDTNAPAFIVFEDDAPIMPDFKKRLEKVLADLPPSWDMVQFQLTTYGSAGTGCKPIPGSSPWQNCTSLMGAYGYMINGASARKLLERAYPIELHVDAYMSYMARMGHIKMLWHPLIDIPGPDNGSDITHGSLAILSVPTEMEKAGVVAVPVRSVVGMMAMAAVVGGMIALAYTVKLPARR
jgi:GR25 family glycosyltransferase involved in LPS biosynthesis